MSDTRSFEILTYGAQGEKERRQQFVELLRQSPIPDDELLMNLGLYLTPQTLSRVLFMDFLYRQVVDLQGVVMDFGCRWGQNTSLFTALRGIYEPFNRLRKIVAFDTFAGFPGVHQTHDGGQLQAGGYATTEGYDEYLAKVIAHQEAESPLPHITKHEIVKGDATHTIHDYLARNPETIVSLAYFDMDIYEPTVACLRAIQARLTKGSVIGFDEVNDHATPGETVALQEVFGLGRYAVRRYRFNSRTSYLVVE
jgi:hypothetical protein